MTIATVVATILSPMPASAACPDAQTAARGFKLTHASGRFLEVTKYDGDVVHYREQVSPSAATARDITAYRGVLGLSSEGAGERNEIVWAGSLAALFPLKAGASHDLDFVVRSSKGTERKAHIRLEIGSAMAGLAVGRCGYEVWPLKREVVFHDTGLKVSGTDYWSPVLRMYLRRDIRVHVPGKGSTAGGPSSDGISLTYDTIEARP